MKFTRILALLLCAVMLLSTLAGCKGGSGDGEGDEGSAKGEKTEYSVTLKTEGGLPLSEIDVYIYKNDKLEDMETFAKTDSEGKVSFQLAKSDKYAIVLSGIPKGYDVKDSYSFKDQKAKITLKSSLITGEDITTATLGLGDVMYDFTVMAADGTEITLSEVLKEKKVAVLNFWYTTCSWCVTEFPLIEDMYKEYKDDVEVIALDPYPTDSLDAIKTFQVQHQLTFPMASVSPSWSNTFGISGYPTTVFVDRYGVICLVEAGAVTSKRPWACAFEHFTAEDYEQKLCTGGIGDLVTQLKPNVEMPESDVVAQTINKGNITVSYRAETEDKNAEYIWPFVIGEKLGNDCLYASNKGVEDSYAIMYADVTLKAGQAFGLDYLASSEKLNDKLIVIVNDEDIFQIFGVSEKEEWKSCYPVVADKDGTYEVAFCFVKDADTNEGDDTVYLDNFRVIDAKDIDVATYLPKYAATTEDDGETYTYVDIVYSEKDGYYHVGKADGPILLADLKGYTQFNSEESLQDIVYNGDADKDGVSLYNKKADGGLGMVQYFSYASNSQINGICPVTKELRTMLEQVAEVAGFTDDPNEWLRICKYFAAYGKGAGQFEDPIKGVATFAALTATLGKDVSTNYFYYDRAIHPRGMYAKFTPAKSGVYRFTSKSDYQDGIDAWIFDGNGNVIYTYEHDERMYTDDINCSMVYYMEAGKDYFINMAFWDIYATGYIYYDVEFLGDSIKLFRLCAPGYFTYDSDATGDQIYAIIAAGVDVELKNGKYYTKEDNSLVYCDFSGLTTVFSNSILEMINMGGFDFSKSETDGEILAYLKQNGGDVEKTTEFLKKLWGEDYEANCELYKTDDVFNGRYHGTGKDYTETIKKYVDKIDKSGTERDGCVEVDKELAEVLQLLMDKYTFAGVENSWLKLCYYYDYMGPQK